MRLLYIKLIICLSISFIFMNCSQNSPIESQTEENKQITINLINEINQIGSLGEPLENPITIQAVNTLQQPVKGVSLKIQINRGDGELLLNNERSSVFNVVSDSIGMADIFWILGNEIDNFLEITVAEYGYISEPLLLSAVAKPPNEVLLLSFRWIETHEFQFPHVLPPYYVEYDGHVLESNHFLTFSDASTDDIRLEFATLAESSFLEILEEFEIQNGNELGIVDNNSKVKIYTRKNFDKQPQQYTFSYGFFLYGKDSEWQNIWYPGGYTRFNNEIKHEVMHMVQFLMGVHYDMCDDWFMEGIAEEISGGAHIPITTVAQLEAWLANPMYSVNPIDIRTTNDYPDPYLETSPAYYPMFHLIMSYLLNDIGFGKNYIDVKLMFEEIAVTNNFNEAFHNNFGITTESLKDSLFQHLRQFLTN
jgi:hypothetical protein